MHKLNDPGLLAQCTRIKAMIEKVAEASKYKKDYYAARYHHWKFSLSAQLWEIEEFEKMVGIELSDEYVYYLTQVGRGGVCPGTKFHDFPKLSYKLDSIPKVSEKLSEILSEEDWNARYGEEGHDNWEELGDEDALIRAFQNTAIFCSGSGARVA